MRVMSVFGTRPEAIKMAPLVKMLAEDSQIESLLCVTAQHREMLDQVLSLFQLEPDFDLNIMKPNQTIGMITASVMEGMEQVLRKTKPDVVLVHGDTTTTFATALSAFYEKISVGHVEAGLRTHDKSAPWPEEVNRCLTGILADIHFAPTQTAKKNLLNEGVPADKIFVTGNTVIDALLATVQRDYRFNDEILDGIDYNRRRVLLVTTHRRENLGAPMREIYGALRSVVEHYPDVEVIFPVHKNPAVRDVVDEELGSLTRVHLIEPMDYQPFVNLINKVYLVLSDSGGIQEEAPSLGKPVLVLRNTTERPEAVKAGTVRLIGTGRDTVATEIRRLLDDNNFYQGMANAVNPYGDGLAAHRIAQAIKYWAGISSSKPATFNPGIES